MNIKKSPMSEKSQVLGRAVALAGAGECLVGPPHLALWLRALALEADVGPALLHHFLAL